MKKINKSLALLLIVTIFSPSLVVFADDTLTADIIPEILIETTAEINIDPQTQAEINLEAITVPEISISSESTIPTNETEVSATSIMIIPEIVDTTETQISATPVVPTTASAFTFETDKASYILGETVTVKVKLNASGATVNSIISQIGFPGDKLEIESIIPGDVVTLWTQNPVYSANTIDLTGVIPNGYNGTDGRVLTITFKSIASGNAEIKFNTLFVQGSDLQNLNMTDPFSSYYFSIEDAFLVNITDFSDDTGISDSDYTTMDNTPTFTGTAIPDSTVNIQIINTCGSFLINMGCAAVIIGSGVSDVNGNWTITTNELIDGNYTIQASVINNSEVMNSGEFNFWVDTQKPIIENAYLHNGAGRNIFFNELGSIHINRNSPIINVVFSDTDYPLNSSIVFWDMSKVDPMVTPTDISYYKKIGYSKDFTVDTNINYDLTDLNLPDGNYRALILAEDLAGNKIDIGENTFVFTIDTIAPDAPVITSPVSQEHDYSNSIEFSGTCNEEGSRILLTFEDVALYKGDEYPKLEHDFGFETNCIEGKFTTKISNDLEPFSPINLLPNMKIAAVQADNAGNMSKISNIITLTHQIPMIKSISNETKLDGQIHVVNNKNPKLYGEARPNSKIQLYDTSDHLAIIEGVESYTAVYAKTTTDNNGNFTFEAPFTTINNSLELGEYNFLVCEIDYDICYTPGSSSKISFNVKIIEATTSNGGGGGGGGSSSNTNINICPLKILGDINCDGKVNKYDFALMMMAWGFKVSDKADLNIDIKVDKYDFALLMSNWGYGEVKR